MNQVNDGRKGVVVAARVPPELAAAVERLAQQGDRTISREVNRALREHVALAQIPLEGSGVPFAASESSEGATADLQPRPSQPPGKETA